jgi:hypothetical protein
MTMTKIAIKVVKKVKAVPGKSAKVKAAGKDVNTDALEALHTIKSHHYRYK